MYEIIIIITKNIFWRQQRSQEIISFTIKIREENVREFFIL
jgi:hypothetical protein